MILPGGKNQVNFAVNPRRQDSAFHLTFFIREWKEVEET